MARSPLFPVLVLLAIVPPLESIATVGGFWAPAGMDFVNTRIAVIKILMRRSCRLKCFSRLNLGMRSDGLPVAAMPFAAKSWMTAHPAMTFSNSGFGVGSRFPQKVVEV